jgi:hypothetical protein
MPDKYKPLVDRVDVIYSDVAQPEQAKILADNADLFLKPGGWTVLIWNERKTDSTPFLRAYEQLLLTYGTDYSEVRHERTTAEIADFFAPSAFQSRVFGMSQEFDYAALEGRLLSSSYTPQPGHPNYEPMLRELRRMFEEHRVKGHVDFQYETRVFYGQLT